LYSPRTSSRRRSIADACRGGKTGPLLLLAPPRPACIRTFIVSRGWMVDWEAARAMAPATTSCAGFWSGCGGGGGGAGGAATAAVVGAMVALLLAAAAAVTEPSLPVGCRQGTGLVA
jgi:hypothetical protein